MSRDSLEVAQPLSPRDRVTSIDMLRGFALFGILLVNIKVFARVGALPDRGPLEYWTAVLLDAKFYTLFLFLFGYGVAGQLSRLNTVWPLRRRLALLLVIGVLHGVLLWEGDILTAYAVIGFLLLAMRGVTTRRALRRAGWLYGLSLLLLGALTFARGFDTTDPVRAAQQTADAFNAPAASVIATRAVSYAGSTATLVLLLLPVLLGTMLLGLAAGRANLFTSGALTPARSRRIALTGLGIGLPVTAVWTWLWPGQGEGAGAFIEQATAPLITAGYVALLLLAWDTAPGRRVLSALVPLGRLSLTSYLTQSLLCAFLFTGYGLALGGELTSPAVLGVAVAIYLAQLAGSHLYLRWFRIGPAEWLLRSFTYLRAQPLRTPGTRPAPQRVR
ncbi:DUF418 domain-containing protein [Crossiella cryophila]|uniref:DUF418 domain-containing protein n=1 Tax=Crossiella cryophila TaxID=43355 RepID=A0A7W7CGQ0_9PSEU|nr:DUF418 domain-containing protein [Crossiella cryophila]MBB4680627.1 uncharacterized protein [Crossiella cryophila]